VLIPLAYLPPLLVLMMLGSTIQKLVVVTHVEEMRSSEKISKTIRHMKARKAMVALKLLTKLKKTSHTIKSKGPRMAGYEQEIPAPVNAEHVTLPPSIEALSEHLAELAHHDWCDTKTSAGWTFGPVRDNDLKVHPELIKWTELPEGSKQYNRDECMSQLKVRCSFLFDQGLRLEECC
jgi:hypothetical protein